MNLQWDIKSEESGKTLFVGNDKVANKAHYNRIRVRRINRRIFQSFRQLLVGASAGKIIWGRTKICTTSRS